MLVWTLIVILGALQSSSRHWVESGALSQQKSADDRLDCWLSDETADEKQCLSLGCLWDNKVGAGVPTCYFPQAGYGYKIAETVSDYSGGFTLDLEKFPAKPRFGDDVQKLKFDVYYYGDSIVRVKFTDPENQRYEVPMFKDVEPQIDSKTQGPSKFQVGYGSDAVYGFNFQVQRTDGQKTTIFNSSIGGLTFSDQFLQLATYLPKGSSLYGIGENPHPSYQHDMRYRTWPLFSRDASPIDGFQNVYGVHPFYLCLENDGRAHGLFFVNSNAMEFTTLPAPGVSIRTTGGVLDFYLFVGNSPKEVITLYQTVIGKPFMPPYWALGFQLSRWGYKNTEDIAQVINRTKENSIPYDVQYSDIDYMDQKKDFTFDPVNFKDLGELVTKTKEDDLRWIFILDPAILAVDPNYEPYNEAKAQDLFIHWPNDIPSSRRSNPPGVDTTKSVIYGNVWPSGPVAFPDFFRSGTSNWWKRSIGQLYKDIKFDGLWIDMNEPSNFQTNEPLGKNDPWHLMCPSNKYDDPAYLPLAARTWGRGLRLSQKTLCMASVQGDRGQYRHYDVHSLYGWSEMEPSISAARTLTGERSIVFSRSTYPSSGKHGGHWLGDNFSRWVDLHRSVIGMLEFNLFGIPYIGADICGFNANSTAEMCKRWMQLGAFYPLSRNHNTLGAVDQDPAAWGGDVLEAAREALTTRYRLLPYLYTLFHAAHTRANKVINGLMDLYPKDDATRKIDTQFLWGDGLLISPALFQGQKDVNVYLPDDDWYEYYSGLILVKSQGGGGQGTNVTVASLDKTPLHVRGGSIIPTQEPSTNTAKSRKNPFTILVYPSSTTVSAGELFWDDGVSIDSLEKKAYLHYSMQYTKNKDQNTFVLQTENPDSTFEEEIVLKDVIMFNTTTTKTVATLNGNPVPIQTNDLQKSIAIVLNQKVQNVTKSLTITW